MGIAQERVPAVDSQSDELEMLIVQFIRSPQILTEMRISWKRTEGELAKIAKQTKRGKILQQFITVKNNKV